MIRNAPKDAAVYGVDLGKNLFHVVGLDDRGVVVQRVKFRRDTLLIFFERAARTIVGMEACPGSQWLARKLQAMGYQVRIVPAQFVKPYVKSQKNDTIDAEAIAEAVTRPTMRFTQVRTVEQVDLQALHRIRDQLVSSRTRLINQVRAFCLEYGVAIRQGAGVFRLDLPRVLADETNDLSPAMRRMLTELFEDVVGLDCAHSPKPLVKRLCGRFPAQCFSWPSIKGGRDGGDLVGAVDAQVRAFREVLTQQPVRVLVGATLPWALRVAEVDLHARVDLETIMLGHFGSLIPSQRTTQFFGQGDDGARNRIAHGLSSMSRERRTILHARSFAVPGEAGKMQQHREARGALDQRADRRAAKAQDEVSFPVSRHRSIGRFGGASTDHDLRRDETFAAPAYPRPGHPQHASCSQAGGQLAAQRSPALNEEGLIDGFVADAHRLVVREVDRQASSNLLRAPGPGPSPILSRAMPPALPRNGRTRNGSATRGHHDAGKSVLHISA